MTFERLGGVPQAEREAAVTEIFGDGATAEESFGLLTVDVPATSWVAALTAARDVLGCTYFDWLSAVDEPEEYFSITAHVVALGTPVRRLLVRTRVPYEAASLPTATGVYAGASWHERETHEMFGVTFSGHPLLAPLLLPDGFEGHPLRKSFVLAARVAKAWPGAKDPGESDHGGGPRRRQTLPPGVPDPGEWGPMKGKIASPAARERPAKGARAATGDRPAKADRPRRARSVSQGSVSQSGVRAADTPWRSEPVARAQNPPGRAPGETGAASGSVRPGTKGTGTEGIEPQPGGTRPGPAPDADRPSQPEGLGPPSAAPPEKDS